MNSRLQALIDRGYSREEVIRLSSFTADDLEYASKKAFEHISLGCKKTDKPTIIYIGGQPGSGKTILSMEMKKTRDDFVEIGIDNYRMYHPHYLEIERCIRNHWNGKEETINSSSGNDVADFTHMFAGAMADVVTEMSTRLDEDGKSYNVLMEWGMRDPATPLKMMNNLKQRGYNNIVLFMGTSGKLSYEACKLRANIMKHSNRIFRKVPKSFHDLCIDTLPDSIDVIYSDGYKTNVVDYMAIITREGKVLWDINSKTIPSVSYKECLNDNNSIGYNDAIKALEGNNRELVGLMGNIEKLNHIKEVIVTLSPDYISKGNVNIK